MMMMMRVVFAILASTQAYQLAAAPLGHRAVSTHSTAVTMREPDARSKSREQLLPDILKALDDVSRFIARADASRQRKPEAPSAECIEAYCAKQQKKIDLLLAEAKLMREKAPEGKKVRWTDIDGNLHNDAEWLK